MLVSSMDEKISSAFNMIVRPPKYPYDIEAKLKENKLSEEKHEFLEFTNQKGQTINGTLFEPHNTKLGKCCVIVAHGNACDQTLPGFEVAKQFTSAGVYLFTFDFPGCGNSPEKYITFGCQESHTIVAIAKWLKENKGMEKIALYGHSMGAYSSLFAATFDHSFSSVVAITPYTSIEDFLRIHCDSLVEEDEMNQFVEDVREKIKKEVGCDFKESDLMQHLKEITTPTLVISCVRDVIAPQWMGKLIYKSLEVADKVSIIDKGDHMHQFESSLDEARKFIIDHFLKQ